MIINRLLVTEITKTFTAIAVILVTVAISSKLVSVMGHVAEGEFAGGLLFKLVALQVPELFAFILPLALFLAIILTLGKAFVDNELYVLFACGIGWARVTLLCLGLSLGVMLITGYLNVAVLPDLFVKKNKLLGASSPTLLLESLKPSRFYTVQNGKLAFYVESINENQQQLGGIFIAEVPIKGKDNRWSVMTAKSGKVGLNLDNEQAFITLLDGKRYDGKPGRQDYTIIEYEQYSRLLGKDAFGKKAERGRHRKEVPTKELLFSSDLNHLAELQWRFSVPLSAFILALFAVGFSKIPPRGSRFSKIFPAIVVYIVYYNFLAVAKRGIIGGWIPPYIGLWVVHLVMLIAAIWLLAKTSGRLQQLLSKAKPGVAMEVA